MKILLDVDGVLNVTPRHDPVKQALGTLTDADVEWPDDVETHRVDNHRGETVTLRIPKGTRTILVRLAELGDLVWCTGWRNANQALSPLLGLPNLPVVPLPNHVDGDGPQDFPVKAPFIRLWAADNNVQHLVWLDDDLYGARLYLTSEPPQRHQRVIERERRSGAWRDDWRAIVDHTPLLDDVLCVAVSRHVGLRETDVDRVEAWISNDL